MPCITKFMQYYIMRYERLYCTVTKIWPRVVQVSGTVVFQTFGTGKDRRGDDDDGQTQTALPGFRDVSEQAPVQQARHNKRQTTVAYTVPYRNKSRVQRTLPTRTRV
jgi:hypothetical protein